MARLGDFIEQIRGVSYKPDDICNQSDSDAIAILRANNIQDDGLNFDDLVYVKSKKVSSNQLIKKGDIVVCASSGSKHLVGKASIAKKDLAMSFGAFCKVVRAKNILPEYLGHYFQSPAYRNLISHLAGGANINNIRNEHIDELRITIPDVEKQKEISKNLDKISDLISYRRKQLYKLDELVKARFVEMFGDPTDIRLSRVPLIEYVENTKYGTSQPPQFDENGCFKFIRATNIKSGHINEKDMLFISKEESEKIGKCKLNGGEIIIVRSGANTGDTCVITDEYKGQYAGYDIIVTLKTDKLNPVFLNELINIPRYMKTVVKPLTARSAQPHLNTQQVQSLPILVVDIDKQKEFAVFVEQIDKSKFAVQQSLDKLETLKKSLMQKYFG